MIAAISFSCSRGVSPSMQTLPLLRQLLEPHRAISSLDQRENRFLSTPSADGITGNGHMLMLERNSDALAQLIIDWIES
jgi:hypothetical protein